LRLRFYFAFAFAFALQGLLTQESSTVQVLLQERKANGIKQRVMQLNLSKLTSELNVLREQSKLRQIKLKSEGIDMILTFDEILHF
jgi:hypothetical protein